jgi:hypothetical protein
MKNFDADKEISPGGKKETANLSHEGLFLSKFTPHRNILSFCLSLHITGLFVFFIINRFKNFEAITKNKANFSLCFFIYLLSLGYLEDFKYSLFRKHKNDGFIEQFINYEKHIFTSVRKNYLKSSIESITLSQGESMNVHVLLKDLENIEKEYKKIIEGFSSSSHDFSEKHREMDKLKNLKREIERKILEINKNKLL